MGDELRKRLIENLRQQQMKGKERLNAPAGGHELPELSIWQPPENLRSPDPAYQYLQNLHAIPPQFAQYQQQANQYGLRNLGTGHPSVRTQRQVPIDPLQRILRYPTDGLPQPRYQSPVDRFRPIDGSDEPNWARMQRHYGYENRDNLMRGNFGVVMNTGLRLADKSRQEIRAARVGPSRRERQMNLLDSQGLQRISDQKWRTTTPVSFDTELMRKLELSERGTDPKRNLSNQPERQRSFSVSDASVRPKPFTRSRSVSDFYNDKDMKTYDYYQKQREWTPELQSRQIWGKSKYLMREQDIRYVNRLRNNALESVETNRNRITRRQRVETDATLPDVQRRDVGLNIYSIPEEEEEQSDHERQ